jgi:hypothetical protein
LIESNSVTDNCFTLIQRDACRVACDRGVHGKRQMPGMARPKGNNVSHHAKANIGKVSEITDQ